MKNLSELTEIALNNIPLLVSYMDTNLNYIYVNKSYEEWFGVSKEKCLKSNMKDIVGVVGLERVQKYLDAAIGGEQQEFEIELPYRFGGSKKIHVKYFPDKDLKGSVQGIIVVVEDLTEQLASRKSSDEILQKLQLSETRLRYALDASGEGIWDWNLKDNTVSHNLKWCQLLGLDEKYLVHPLETFANSIHIEDKPLVMERLERALAGQGKYESRHRLRHKSGHFIWVYDRGQVVERDASGNPMRMTGSLQEITEFVRQQEEISQLTSKLKRDNETLSYQLELASITNQILKCAQLDMSLDKKMEEILLLVVENKVLPLKYSYRLSIRKNAVASSDEIAIQRDFNEKESDHHIDLALVGSQGDRLGVLTLVLQPQVKVTERFQDFLDSVISVLSTVLQNEMLRSSLKEERTFSIQNSRMATLGDMSTGIAHEISNPLAIIAGSISLLDRYRGDQGKFQNKIDVVLRAVTRIQNIIKALKKFNSSGKGARSNENLLTMVTEVLSFVDSRAKRSGVQVELDIDPETTLSCDPGELEQALMNLIINGIDAAKLAQEKWVKVQGRSGPSGLSIKVMDSGPGIPEKIETQIFEPFFTTKPVGEGMGLGLSIVKSILDEHKATIKIDRTNRNTCFELFFANTKNSAGNSSSSSAA